MTSDEPPRTPRDLAEELGIPAPRLRAWLRQRFPRAGDHHARSWTLTDELIAAAREHFTGRGPQQAGRRAGRRGRRREHSDQGYVTDLCDELLGERARREYTFDWLLGDPGRDGRRRRLPVDAYYPTARLVVEYAERQHERATPFFDKPDIRTVSGVDRREQRRTYDQRRLDEIPRHELRVVVVRADDLECDARGRLRRNIEHDRPVLRHLLAAALEDEVLRRLNGWGGRPTKRQLAMLVDLAAIYRDNGVLLADRACSLHGCCPDRALCWKGQARRKSTRAELLGDGEDNSIFWPFVGRRYRRGGVCLVGWNLNHDGTEWFGLPQEFVNADHDRGLFARGRKKNEWNSAFAYRSLAAGLAVDDARRGVPATADPEPDALMAGMQRLTRVQAVKCESSPGAWCKSSAVSSSVNGMAAQAA